MFVLVDYLGKVGMPNIPSQGLGCDVAIIIKERFYQLHGSIGGVGQSHILVTYCNWLGHASAEYSRALKTQVLLGNVTFVNVFAECDQ